MNPIAPAELLAQLNWRYATKQFDPQRKIDAQTWSALEATLVLTPSSFGLQPWKFLVVTDPAVREQLVPASWGQRQVADASHLVVFTVKRNFGAADIDTYLNRIVTVRGTTRDSLNDYRDMMVDSLITSRDAAGRKSWATNQTYIALGNFLTSAALLGIDTCPLEGIELAKYDQILGLEKQGLTTAVAAAAGYRAATDKYASVKKVRFQKSEVVVEV